MKRGLILRAAELIAQRPAGTDDDIHFTETLAESVILHTTEPGDLVLDPFAGYGTTLSVAERLGRRAIGVELVAEHVEIARGRTGDGARLIHGDARLLRSLVDEAVDLVLTSPPYMPSANHPENPLTGYATADGEYPTYLRELGVVFGQAASLLRPGRQTVVNVANVIARDGTITPLASDVAQVIAEHLTLLGTTQLDWDERPAGLADDYLLWFQRTEPPSPSDLAARGHAEANQAHHRARHDVRGILERPDSISRVATTTSVFRCRLPQCLVPPIAGSRAKAPRLSVAQRIAFPRRNSLRSGDTHST